MAGIDPWTGARLGDDDDAPTGGTFLARVVTDLRLDTCPAFPTQADRDGAIAQLLAAGVTIRDGMSCWTNDTACFWDRVAGAWVARPHFGDTDWQTITPTGGWTPVTSGGAPGLHYRVINGECWGVFRINGVGNWTGGNTVFTMPSGARPPFDWPVRITKDNTDGIASGQIQIDATSGAAVINIAGQAGNDIYGAFNYPVN